MLGALVEMGEDNKDSCPPPGQFQLGHVDERHRRCPIRRLHRGRPAVFTLDGHPDNPGNGLRNVDVGRDAMHM